MPFTKSLNETAVQLWKINDQKAQKSGVHHTIYSVNKDEYIGEWKDNKKHGKGIQKWYKSGMIYDGDWRDDKRTGYGSLSTTSSDGKVLKKKYAGGWKSNKRHGYGTNIYDDGSHYEGEWYEDMRCGWGRMFQADGSSYEGEWFDDKRCGHGLELLSNRNRYEGSWKNNEKNGQGKFYHLNKGQCYEGTWVNGVAKCGEMKKMDDSSAVSSKFLLPHLKLQSPENVLQEAENVFYKDV